MEAIQVVRRETGRHLLFLNSSGDFAEVDQEGRQRSIQDRGIDIEAGIREATDVLEELPTER
ncbi:hypothetical protein PF005_g32872 [Phytophthora fragariae]|uniref:Uncharacterized protein n=1 Tax=Phytophthora fragariae TaxID=53985 RepID=A0A6A3UXY0_9STRA|nr:hypothetical protein PF010_g23475 [Phytophthora fragariae]KAE9157339.1 hypothetical protein PF005_g32872 [Phytophthora fragariae]KAE9161523.1 hypothetical protein PF004_g30792 [Phytophthora fragariae]